MSKQFNLARVFLCILTIIVCRIMLINDIWENFIIVSQILVVATLVISFITTPISKKILKIGDNRPTKIKKIIYYSVLFPCVLLLAIGGMCLTIISVEFIWDLFSIDVGWGLGFFFLFVYACVFICILVPYMLVLFVLIIRAFENKYKRDSSEEESLCDNKEHDC